MRSTVFALLSSGFATGTDVSALGRDSGITGRVTITGFTSKFGGATGMLGREGKIGVFEIVEDAEATGIKGLEGGDIVLMTP